MDKYLIALIFIAPVVFLIGVRIGINSRKSSKLPGYNPPAPPKRPHPYTLITEDLEAAFNALGSARVRLSITHYKSKEFMMAEISEVMHQVGAMEYTMQDPALYEEEDKKVTDPESLDNTKVDVNKSPDRMIYPNIYLDHQGY